MPTSQEGGGRTHHVLFDVLADDALAADLDLDGPEEDAARQGLHLAREGGAEQHTLTVRPHVVDYPHHLKMDTATGITSES